MCGPLGKDGQSRACLVDSRCREASVAGMGLSGGERCRRAKRKAGVGDVGRPHSNKDMNFYLEHPGKPGHAFEQK